MTKEKENQMNALCDKVLTTLDIVEMETVKALVRAAYRMGYDDAVKARSGTLEFVNFPDSLLPILKQGGE